MVKSCEPFGYGSLSAAIRCRIITKVSGAIRAYIPAKNAGFSCRTIFVMESPSPKEYLTIPEAAKLLRIAEQTLRNRMSLDRVSFRHGKRRAFGKVIFDKAALIEALERGDLG